MGPSAPEIRVSRSALRANLAAMRAAAPAGTLFAPIVKANAYGHGRDVVARLLADDVDMFTVAEPADALALTEIAPGRILCLGPAYGAELRELAAHDVAVSVSRADALPDLGPGARVHLIVDTGIRRLGATAAEAPALAAAIRSTGATLEGVFCHVAGADRGDWSGVEAEVAMLRELPIAGVIRHAGGSSLVLERPDLIGDLARPGIGLFGCYPNPAAPRSVTLRAVLTLVAPVLETRDARAGDAVGYTGARLERDATVATLAAGVAHGLDPRWMDGGGHVEIRGVRCRLLTPPMLDYTIVDVSAIPDIRRGEPATIIDASAGRAGGDATEDGTESPLSAQAIARRVGETAEHILVRLNGSVERTVVP